MFYLEINPETFEAIGGVYQKVEGHPESFYTNYRPLQGDAEIGCIWNEELSTWSDRAAVLTTIEEVRIKRDHLLKISDWRVAVSDYPNEDKDQWVTYRQLLRNFPSSYTPTEVPDWPEAPS